MSKVIEFTKAKAELGKRKQEKIDYKKMKEKKKERKLTPYVFDNGNYIEFRVGFLNYPRRCKSLRNPTTLLLYLLQWKGWKGSKGRSGKWYRRGFVISSRSQEQTAVDLGVSEKTIYRWLKELERDKVIEIKKDGLYNVYVVGRVNRLGEERFYYKD